VPPGSATPEQVIRSVAWSWDQKSVEAYRGLFTEDYRFAFSALDPAGDAYRGDTWIREDEILFAVHLFVGGSPTEPPASSIQLTYSNSVLAADPRPGRNPGWHKRIQTILSLVVTRPDRQVNINGPASFYLVRGDSAQVPPGAARDSTRWYIDRWEDDTASDPGGMPAQAMPASRYTIGQLKASYR
jgi:hypothetical protein